MPFAQDTTARLKALADEACANPKSGVPGTSIVFVGKDGQELFAHTSGKRGLSKNEPMTPDTVFWIASCTKLITGIACLQLIEKGILRLDDGQQTEGLLPELKELKVLRPDGSLEDKKKTITLRMLLTHTAGFGYSFFNERLRDWASPMGIDEFSGRFEDMKQPLLFQPGEGWEYGVSTSISRLASG